MEDFRERPASKNTGLGTDKLVWPLTGCATLGKLLNLSVSPLGPCLKIGTSILNFIGLVWV